MLTKSRFAIAPLLFWFAQGAAHAQFPINSQYPTQISFFDTAGRPEPGTAAPAATPADTPATLPANPNGKDDRPEKKHVGGFFSFLPPAKNTAESDDWAEHVPIGETPYRTFGSKVGKVKWETLGLLGYFTVVNSPKLFKPMESFHFKNEGWFGKSTANIGVDKLTHAFDSYLLAEFLHARLHRKTDGASGDALTASVLASGLMIYSELSDGIEADGGFSYEDVIANTAGAAFSALRNSVPGLRDKLDFRLLYMPGPDIYTRTGKQHYEEQRYLFALQLSGFEAFKNTPLRLVELHAGYYASGFTNEDRAKGEIPKRHLFFGIGLNVRELFFRNPESRVGRTAATALDYFQIPYTAAHWD
jgi:hypothetical protein